MIFFNKINFRNFKIYLFCFYYNSINNIKVLSNNTKINSNLEKYTNKSLKKKNFTFKL